MHKDNCPVFTSILLKSETARGTRHIHTRPESAQPVVYTSGPFPGSIGQDLIEWPWIKAALAGKQEHYSERTRGAWLSAPRRVSLHHSARIPENSVGGGMSLVRVQAKVETCSGKEEAGPLVVIGERAMWPRTDSRRGSGVLCTLLEKGSWHGTRRD
ncbi:hypothetical protein OE88DRAFT_1647382 [Heliocybe sulcata]|uniref:Uncharacterized protein n=1 Tax=Heliocybe sulcata TaxID=5364 RepID=A0A5C3MSV4_9AGAM|nr:hypothetical protein OE88DRAFT_1647382 [Heliocybe sulcata]